MELPLLNLSNPALDVYELVQQLHKTGCLVVKDDDISLEANERFLDMMEVYFGQSTEEKMRDMRPDSHYQVGVTPEGVELSRCTQDPKCMEFIEDCTPENRPTKPSGKDPKWRFMYHISETSPCVNQVVPDAFKHEWVEKMDAWGKGLLRSVVKVAARIEEGLGLSSGVLVDLLKGGHHLLAPTGTDVRKYSDLNTVYASYHCDISFMTIHGKSRFPGLFIWLRDGTKIPVKIPSGCLLLQVGKQLEWLTAGYFKAGYHEVICTDQTINQLKRNRTNWRVSSTLFAHVNSDALLEPKGGFISDEYPTIRAGDFVDNELKTTNLYD